jgi:hypothetical protein
MTDNQIKIKLTGKLEPLKVALKRIESLYPVFLEGEFKQNDADDGYHVFLTVPAQGA